MNPTTSSIRLSVLGLLLCLGIAACAGPATDAPVAKEETDTQVVDIHGKPVDPLRCDPKGVSVLIFITSDCPIANGYAPQLQAMFAANADRPVAFHLVHVDPDLTAEAARKHAAEYGYDGSILLDPEHRLVRRAAASVTPEAFVFAADGGVRYGGRINNWYGDIGRKRVHISKHELQDAIDAVLAGKPVAVQRTAAVGCTIEPIDN